MIKTDDTIDEDTAPKEKLLSLHSSNRIFIGLSLEAIAGLSSLAADHWVETAAGRY